ncbi:MAG: hypothetical protein Q9211_004734 [Gyalolechia sp. 1 TL-2023]
MAPWSRFFKNHVRGEGKAAASPIITSTAFATETPQSTRAQEGAQERTQGRRYGLLDEDSSDNSGSDSNDSALTSSGAWATASVRPQAGEDREKALEKRLVRLLKKGLPCELKRFLNELLLHEFDDGIRITEAMVLAAKGNELGGERPCDEAALILDERRGIRNPIITRKVLRTALDLFKPSVRSAGIGAGIVKLGFRDLAAMTVGELQNVIAGSASALGALKVLLHEPMSSSKLRLTEGWLVAVAMNRTCGAELVELLLRERGGEVRITEWVLETAAQNDSAGEGIYKLLFRERGTEIRAISSGRVLLAACQNADSTCGRAIVKMLLGTQYHGLRVTENMVEATNRNRLMKETMKMLLYERTDSVHFTAAAFDALARLHDPEMLAVMLEVYGDRIKIPPSFVEVAAANPASGRTILEYLLEEHADEIKISERVLIAIVRNESRQEIVEVLFRKCAEKLRVTERVLEAATKLPFHSREHTVLQIMFDLAESDIRITTKMLQNAAVRGFGDDSKLHFLLPLLLAGKHAVEVSGKLARCLRDKNVCEFLFEQGNGIRITDEAATEFAKSGDLEILTLLFEKRRTDPIVQETLLIAGTGRSHKDEIPELLLSHPWVGIDITRRVVDADNDSYHWRRPSEMLIHRLLQQFGHAVRFKEDAFEALMQHSTPDAVQLLLETYGSEMTVTTKALEAAARNKFYGGEVFTILLNELDDDIRITESTIELAVLNKYSGARILRLLLAERGDEIQLSERVLETTAEKWPYLMEWLHSEANINIQLTERVVEATARWHDGSAIHALIRKYSAGSQMTERVLEAAVRNEKMEEDVLRSLVAERGNEVQITRMMMEAAAKNEKHGLRNLILFLERQGDDVEITERVLEAAAANPKIGDQIIRHLLDEYGEDIEITERVLEAAAGNVGKGETIVAMIYRKLGSNFNITERMIEAAAANLECGLEIVQHFLNNIGNEIQITSRILIAAAENNWSSYEIVKMLHERCDESIYVSESVIEAVARIDELDYRSLELICLFFRSQHIEVQNTERVLELLARRWSFILLELLLEDRKEIQLTNNVLAEAVLNHEFLEIQNTDRLLQVTKGKIQVTSRIAEAAAANTRYGVEMIKLLLEERGDEFKINEKILKAAAKNETCGVKVIDEILRQRGDSGEIRITEGVLEAAASNRKDADQIIDQLLQWSGDSIELTDSIVEAAENTDCREQTLEVFRLRGRR